MDDSSLFKMSILTDGTSYDTPSEGSVPTGQWPDPENLLNHPVSDKYPFKCEVYDLDETAVQTEADRRAAPDVKAM